jgi:alpha/beta hydrolase family protein/hemolysin type calcium-binding protein
MVRRGLAAAVCCLASTSASAAAAPQGAVSAGAIADLPVAFQVRNTNTSGLSCPSDGAEYTVRGPSSGPASALASRGTRAVTLYLHGFNAGEWMWRPPGVPELDHSAALARLGHVSVTVDRLGYDTSDHPQGFQSCLCSQADIAHQLVGKLRRGDYAVTGARPTTFPKVVLAGHDSGGAIAEIEAYSYRGSGPDRVLGGSGRDLVDSGAGNDRIEVADGRRDHVRCGSGLDRVRADRHDRLTGCERREVVPAAR